MIAKGNTSVTLEEILDRMSEADILAYYLGVYEVPTIINSPLRQDKRPSFGLYSLDGKRIYYTDLSTKDRGGLFDLLGKMWNCSYLEVLERINKDIIKGNKSNIKSYTPCNVRVQSSYNSNSDLQCKIREWRDYDIEYWASFGISLEWLKWAEVWPISHKIIIKNGQRYVFGTDKYAYVFIERKEGKITQKIYQPFNKYGYKWCNKNDGSVIGLWAKLPEYGDKVCICSSLKDSLCLSANIKIPTIYLQGEGYNMSKTAISELKRRFKQVYILLDNDPPGIKDGAILSEQTGFTNVVLPHFDEGKDIAEYYQHFGKEKFIEDLSTLFTSSRQEIQWESDLPFDVD